MAFEILRTKSINATATFASKQYTFVKIDTSGQLASPNAGQWAIGVIQDKPIAASPGAVCYPGDITKVMVGTGGFNEGDFVTTDASGKAIAAYSGAHILGVALSTGVAASLADIIYQPAGKL
jgi:hypothetical protein